jgi:hypothetical protein
MNKITTILASTAAYFALPAIATSLGFTGLTGWMATEVCTPLITRALAAQGTEPPLNDPKSNISYREIATGTVIPHFLAKTFIPGVAPLTLAIAASNNNVCKANNRAIKATINVCVAGLDVAKSTINTIAHGASEVYKEITTSSAHTEAEPLEEWTVIEGQSAALADPKTSAMTLTELNNSWEDGQDEQTSTRSWISWLSIPNIKVHA